MYPLPVFNELDASAVHLCSEISDNFVNLSGLGSLDIAFSGLSWAHCDYLLIFLFLSKYQHKYKMISHWQTQGKSQVTLRSRLVLKTFSPSNGAVWINRARIVESRSLIEPRDTSRVRQVGTLSQTIPTAGPRGSLANHLKRVHVDKWVQWHKGKTDPISRVITQSFLNLFPGWSQHVHTIQTLFISYYPNDRDCQSGSRHIIRHWKDILRISRLSIHGRVLFLHTMPLRLI